MQVRARRGLGRLLGCWAALCSPAGLVLRAGAAQAESTAGVVAAGGLAGAAAVVAQAGRRALPRAGARGAALGATGLVEDGARLGSRARIAGPGLGHTGPGPRAGSEPAGAAGAARDWTSSLTDCAGDEDDADGAQARRGARRGPGARPASD